MSLTNEGSAEQPQFSFTRSAALAPIDFPTADLDSGAVRTVSAACCAVRDASPPAFAKTIATHPLSFRSTSKSPGILRALDLQGTSDAAERLLLTTEEEAGP